MIAIEAVVALPGPSELALSTGHLALSTGHLALSTGHLALSTGHLALLADHAGHGLLTSVTGEGDAGHSSPESADEHCDEHRRRCRDATPYRRRSGRRGGCGRRWGQDLSDLLVLGRFPP